MHILIVEDDANLVASLEAGLDHAGYQHTLAPSVPDARKELAQTRFDAASLFHNDIRIHHYQTSVSIVNKTFVAAALLDHSGNGFFC